MSKKRSKEPGRPKKQAPTKSPIHIYATAAQKERWKRAAGEGSLSAWIGSLCDEASKGS